MTFEWQRVESSSSRNGVVDGVYRLEMNTHAESYPGRLGWFAVVLNALVFVLILCIFANTLAGLIALPITVTAMLWRRRSVNTQQEVVQNVRA